MKYTKLADNSGDYLALVSHYPNYKKSELKNGGYATVTYIITSGGTKERVALDKNIDESQFTVKMQALKLPMPTAYIFSP